MNLTNMGNLFSMKQDNNPPWNVSAIDHFPVTDHYQNTTATPRIIGGLSNSLVDPDVMFFRQVIHSIDLYVVPIIATLGIIGNAICFMVFMATYLRKLSSSVYLAALAICDTIYLLTVLFSWMDNVGIDIYHRNGWCQLLTYLGFVTSFLDVWYIVSFTIERYLVVCFPLKRQGLCSPRRAKIVVLSLALLASVLFTFALWTSEVGWTYRRPFCAPKHKYYSTVLALTNVDTVITLVIPTIVIVACNIRITIAVARFYRERAHLEGPRDLRVDSRIVRKPTLLRRGSSHRKSTSLPISISQSGLQMKVTKMLLLVSTTFLICHIPSHGFRVYVFIMSLVSDRYKPSHMMMLIQKLFQYLYIMNFGVNFFLYCISGKPFRRAMVRFVHITRNQVSKFVYKKYTLVRSRSTLRHTREHVQLGVVAVCESTAAQSDKNCDHTDRYS